MEKGIYEFILQEETSYKTSRVPITNSVDWNMSEHIERCTNVSNGWYHKGKNDGNRPYDDVVTPILNVARRTEGFNVTEIVPFVDNVDESYKSFLVKKYHPKWARKHELDTFIDEMVESSIIYDLVLVKNVNNVRPEVIKLQQIAFCDQTNILSGPIGIKHHYSTGELIEMGGKWDSKKIEEALVMAQASKEVSQAGDQEAKTPGKYIEVYEVVGNMPESWLRDGGDSKKYVNQIHIVTYYKDSQGKKNGITLFKGPLKKPIFKALVISPVFGRACGRSIVETLFEPQVWVNYSAIKIKELLDASALNLYQSASKDLEGQKLTNLKQNTVLKHEEGKPTTRLDTSSPNITQFFNHKVELENKARILGSASDAQLGTNPTAGTPFALQNLVVQQGQGIHEWRQGKIATFMADELYRDWILDYLVKDMNGGKNFSEELSLDEMEEIVEQVTTCEIEKKIREHIMKTGSVPTVQDREMMKEAFKADFMKHKGRFFLEILQGELEDIPIDVFVNISGKQRNMAQNADKITNIIREVIRNPQAFTQIPGIAKAFNELIEESGFSPIDFSTMIKDVTQMQPETTAIPQSADMSGGETKQ